MRSYRMPTLPWTAAKNVADPPDGTEVVVMASRFEVATWRDVPPFLFAAMRIRRQMLSSTGAIGISLIARPVQRTFYRLSAWQDRSALDSAVAQQPHAKTMAQFRSRMASSLFAFWAVPAKANIRPSWAEAHERLRNQAGQNW
jgi:hypothetical protein